MPDQNSLPFVSSILPRIGGLLKSEPSHFKVTEIPLYEPQGEGQHFYLNITNENMTTRSVVKSFQKTFNLHERDIGYAGLKDKNAITTQTISLSLGANFPEDNIKSVIENSIPEISINWIKRHINKLKTGHLSGNKFEILITETVPNAFERANAINIFLKENGIPNYYGEQRFGTDGDNATAGKEILKKTKKNKKHWIRKLLLSAYQSHLFNKWLAQRILNGNFNSISDGDLLQNTNGGPTFPFRNENQRDEFKSGIISHTGPMFGSKMTWPEKDCSEYEHELSIITNENIELAMFKNAKLDGTRRAARLVLDDMLIEKKSAGIKFSFSLPKGAYATSVLREFMK